MSKTSLQEKRRSPRMPVLSNIVEPINMTYKTAEGKEQKVLGILADLSATGMRLITFLEAPFSEKIDLVLDVAPLGEVKIKGKTSWVTKKETVFTMGIEFLEINAEAADKINNMALDYVDCDTRILLKLPEVCVATCKACVLCNKLQKDITLFNTQTA
ncbi:PilZ domain-containing protein [Parelusimicrobium proximum]|uniref:PilZ domain-containing protein n=1 Tax=Parelusimicrobium proximum TaxID=3228953 RepID=UPI003D17AE74